MEKIALFDLERRLVLREEPPCYQSKMFKERVAWLKLNQKYEIVVFYNTGKHLFLQQGKPTVDSTLYLPWKWVEYKRFAKGSVLFRKRKNRGRSGKKGDILFRHHGHNYKQVVGLSFLTQSEQVPVRSPEMMLKKDYLYFVSFRKGRRWRTLAQYQQLPLNLFNLYAHELEIISI